mgnify:CR=1 FL=1
MEPLAHRLRPTKLSDVIGQEYLTGKDGIITKMIENNHLQSFVLYGGPGTGKTTIGKIIKEMYSLESYEFNASSDSKAILQEITNLTKFYPNVILIIDEIHRMNKDKQDLLLPHVESGLIVLIGLTTSNPYHKINPAIRSRCQIFELHELTEEEIITGLKRIAKDIKANVDDDAYVAMAKISSGDFRNAINLLDIATSCSSDNHVTLELLKTINSKPVFFHDKNEDGHYDVLSAFQKSIRGSDVDAAMHYLARLIEAGDLDSIYRRMSVIAYEDIGLANPSIGPKVMAAISAAELVGLPEARIPLGTVVCEMALSPKSNSAHLALDNALNDIRKGTTGNVPDHIKTSSLTYKYPHDYPNSWVEQQYLPDNLKNKKYYYPKHNKYEDGLNFVNKQMKGQK